MTNFVAHLTRQAAFSRATFGPGARTAGVSDHIRKELEEIAACKFEDDKIHEWVDVAILALDGLTRSVSAAHTHWTLDDVARYAVAAVVKKQAVNEMRKWPDWRTAAADKAIEHDRTGESN